MSLSTLILLPWAVPLHGDLCITFTQRNSPSSVSVQASSQVFIFSQRSLITLGLVGITPAAGFIPVYVAVLVGAVTSVTCFFAAKYKYLLRVDEGLDIFAIHGVGGVMGDILTGFFASKNVPAMDGASIGEFEYAGGWWDRHYAQMGYQLAAALTCASWSFVLSYILLFIINKIPGCRIRVIEQEELEGLDEIYLEDGPIMGYAPFKTIPMAYHDGVDGRCPSGSVLPSEKTEAHQA